ncbi:Uncharacterised protein [Chlamydia abortus]|nr:Uncharacterised protein [Chlamydia abortus]
MVIDPAELKKQLEGVAAMELSRFKIFKFPERIAVVPSGLDVIV